MSPHGPSVIYFDVHPGTQIGLAMFLSMASDGKIQPLQKGEKFCGVSTEPRQAEDPCLSVLVSTEGAIPVSVEGVNAGDISIPVFATGPYRLTTDPKANGVKVGHVLKPVPNGQTIVKFYV